MKHQTTVQGMGIHLNLPCDRFMMFYHLFRFPFIASRHKFRTNFISPQASTIDREVS